MLYDKRLQELTKSEILILNLIEQSDEYDGSISDTKDCLKISKQTVCRGFKKLVDIGFVTKTEFFEGRIKRCKYTRNGTNSKNVTIQNDYQNKNVTIQSDNNSKNVTTQNVANNSKEELKGVSKQRREKNLEHKKEPSYQTRTPMLYDKRLNLYNINNIYNIQSDQSKDIMVDDACQGVKSIFSKKIDKIFGNSIMDDSENVGKGSIVHTFKTIVKKISREKNENAQVVNKFFGETEEQDLRSVVWGIIGAVARRIADNTKARVRNLYAYMRTAVIKAVQDFFASKVDESEVKTLMYESVQQLHKVPATSISATSHTYTSPAPSSRSKIDTRYLARNFEQREYPEEYFESFYEKFEDEQSSPATSTCAKDSVMEQVRAMRDSFSKRGKIKPLPCADLW